MTNEAERIEQPEPVQSQQPQAEPEANGGRTIGQALKDAGNNFVDHLGGPVGGFVQGLFGTDGYVAEKTAREAKRVADQSIIDNTKAYDALSLEDRRLKNQAQALGNERQKQYNELMSRTMDSQVSQANAEARTANSKASLANAQYLAYIEDQSAGFALKSFNVKYGQTVKSMSEKMQSKFYSSSPVKNYMALMSALKQYQFAIGDTVKYGTYDNPSMNNLVKTLNMLGYETKYDEDGKQYVEKEGTNGFEWTEVTPENIQKIVSQKDQEVANELEMFRRNDPSVIESDPFGCATEMSNEYMTSFGIPDEQAFKLSDTAMKMYSNNPIETMKYGIRGTYEQQIAPYVNGQPLTLGVVRSLPGAAQEALGKLKTILTDQNGTFKMSYIEDEAKGTVSLVDQFNSLGGGKREYSLDELVSMSKDNKISRCIENQVGMIEASRNEKAGKALADAAGEVDRNYLENFVGPEIHAASDEDAKAVNDAIELPMNSIGKAIFGESGHTYDEVAAAVMEDLSYYDLLVRTANVERALSTKIKDDNLKNQTPRQVGDILDAVNKALDEAILERRVETPEYKEALRKKLCQVHRGNTNMRSKGLGNKEQRDKSARITYAKAVEDLGKVTQAQREEFVKLVLSEMNAQNGK